MPPARPTVLVVEDDLALRQFYRVALELRGFSVEVATDGLAALQLIDEGPRPDLILLDLELPRVGGLEFARELASNAATQKIPITSSRERPSRSTRTCLPRCCASRSPATMSPLLSSRHSGVTDGRSSRDRKGGSKRTRPTYTS